MYSPDFDTGETEEMRVGIEDMTTGTDTEDPVAEDAFW